MSAAAVMLSGVPALRAAPIAHAVTPPTEASDAATASAQAKATDQQVEVTGLRDEYAQTFAQPDGTFKLIQSTVPQRAKASDGSWTSVDATLVRRADGTVGPRAAAVDLSFSGGGDGHALLRLADMEHRSITLGWPGELPEPVLDGASATYSEVLPGVDLRLTATLEGYRQVLVVKSAEAAKNPALSKISLSAESDGLSLRPGAGGGLRAVDGNGDTVFNGPAGLMWDSAGDAPTVVGPLLSKKSSKKTGKKFTSRTLSTAGADAAAVERPRLLTGEGEQDPQPAPVDGPSVGDVAVPLPVQVSSGAVAMMPDASLLKGSDTVYPLYIDPPVGLGAEERTVLSSDGDHFWQFNGDYGVGLCSQSGPWYCGSNYSNRMYFEFSPTRLAGKEVLDATFRAYETWSFNCSALGVNVIRTDNISEASRYPGPAYKDLMVDRYVSAGRGDLCSPSQPDAWIDFNDNPQEPDENLTPTVKDFAAGKFSRLTLRISAMDEGDPNAWKRFDDNAELQVIYVPTPGIPTSVGVIPGNGSTPYCSPLSTDPLIVTRADPMLSARVQTLVQPAANDSKGLLRAKFLVQRKVAVGWEQAWGGDAPSTGWHPDDTVESLRIPSQADDVLYRVQASTVSHWSETGLGSGDLLSAPSFWCYFKIDSHAPKPARITAGTPYTQCLPNDCVAAGGTGVPGSFTFNPNISDTGIKKYRWHLITSSAPAAEVSGSTVTVNTVTPTVAGTQTLVVEASDLDADGRVRWGEPSEFTFKVSPGPEAIGRWHFDDQMPGGSGTLAKDSATEGMVRHDATLMNISAGSQWSARGRRGVVGVEFPQPDKSLWLNDTTNPAMQNGYATSSGPAVNTKDSYTVSAWAYLTDASAYRAVLSAPGSRTSALELYYSPTSKQWVFRQAAEDKDAPVYASSVSSSNVPTRVWTHLAGVFDTKGDTDKTNDTIQLFVNGRPQGNPVTAATASATNGPWTAAGGLQFGRALQDGVYSHYFKGQIDEAAVWQVAKDDLREEARLADESGDSVALIADWNATMSPGPSTQIANWSDYNPGSMQLSPSGAVLTETDSTLTLDGVAGYASVTGPVVDETASFTVSAQVHLDSQAWSAKPIGYKAQVFGQKTSGESSWGIWAEKFDPDGDGIAVTRWSFGRTAVDATGNVTATGIVPAVSMDPTDDGLQITGVYDAADSFDGSSFGKLRLYLGATPQLDDTSNAGFTALQQGSGELSIGRGTAGGVTGNYLPGSVDRVRVWTGAMNDNQVLGIA
ncbi:LamG domain-containing protein [Streptomyces sp. NBC_01643]|uniref:LamG domain-containing protein n=1 Tax=Streptomyces sp. NBC_01643 TaxID=2975906 RepID=UPI0038682CD9